MNEITDKNIRTWIEKEAWKRSGFKDKEALFDAVRALPIEERVEMLTELFIRELATKHLEKKQEFLLNLGHKIWIDSDEGYEYACSVYHDGWEVRRTYFSPYKVRPDTLYVDLINDPHRKSLEERRKGK